MQMVSRRNFLKSSAAMSALASLPLSVRWHIAQAATQAAGLSDPALQPKFVNLAPNALNPGFMYVPGGNGRYSVEISSTKNHRTGLINPRNGKSLKTQIMGYGDDRGPTWPGRTFEVKSLSAGGDPETVVRWSNALKLKQHPLPVDTNLHWCYALHGASSANGVDYTQYSIKKNGIPIITHVHGGHSDFQFDGNPEFFYTPDADVRGPQWDAVAGGFAKDFRYDNDVPAGNLWYHDHALGITRLNVYAGLAGFYFVRDEVDTGKADNSLGLPAYPYELAYAIQDRMFTDNGDFFYSAFPGDPFYDDFITGEGVELPPELFPNGGPTALAEFFGDHMVVNGLIWPKENVERRQYRLHLLNGTDSRFMGLQFKVVNKQGITDPNDASASLKPFHVIGSDQGLSGAAIQVDKLVFEPGSRYDIIVDFSDVPVGGRVIMENIAGDAPFGGDFGCGDGDEDCFAPMPRYTDRVMAFDVVAEKAIDGLAPWIPAGFDDPARNPSYGDAGRTTRKVALFEGVDEFGRLQPLLGTVDMAGASHAYTWFEATTETPALGSTEDWEIYNFTGDAHPIHLHLVNFQTLGRNELVATEGEPVPTTQHNGTSGEVASFTGVSKGAAITDVGTAQGYVEMSRKDMVTALPEQVTTIRVSPFDKQGRYVWHCHILSHEDHEMMRVLEVV